MRGRSYLVCEALGRLRVCERARQRGLKGGWSLNLSTPDRMRADLDKAKSMIRRDRPMLLATYPKAKDFDAAVELCAEQDKAGGAFVLIRQRKLGTGKLPAAGKLLQVKEIVGVTFESPALRTTEVITNSRAVAEKLDNAEARQLQALEDAVIDGALLRGEAEEEVIELNLGAVDDMCDEGDLGCAAAAEEGEEQTQQRGGGGRAIQG